MEAKKFLRGSEWRKWDLHIHSNCGSPDQIINAVIEKGISVFSITDHCSVEKIDEFLKIVQNKQRQNKEIYFLPGIELKTDKGKRAVHLIGIFPLQDREGNQINTEYLKQNLLSKVNCSDTDIISAGKKVLEDGKSDQEYKKRGYLEISVPFENAASQIKKLGGITIVHAGEKSSSIEKEMKHAKTEDEFELFNSLGHTKRDLMRKYIDICEVPNWGSTSLKAKDFYLKQFDKPAIICSDSHSLSNIGTKYTWIKADPTFEGLKQIIYEPKLRISLSEKKELYLYPKIISFQFKGVGKYKTSEDKKEFPPINLKKQIILNSNLTSIIGPRASGKTVLVELLSYPFDQHQKEAKKNEKLPLIQFLAKKFSGLSVEVLYQQGEKEPQVLRRDITDSTDPFYASPLTIEYWSQGQIEQVADKKEKINDYLKDRLKSGLLSNVNLEIHKLKEKLQSLREKYFNKFEEEIERNKLLAERKQIEEYFEKLKTPEYKDLVKKIQDNRAKIQCLDAFVENIQTITDVLEESSKQFSFINFPEKEKLLELFPKTSSIYRDINDLYKFINVEFADFIKGLPTLKESIKNSHERKELSEQARRFQNEFISFCEKNGIKITKSEYETRTSRLNLVNRQLRDLESKLKEYEEAKKTHAQCVQQLDDKLTNWKKENNRIIEEFNKLYSRSNIRVVWDDPSKTLSEWVTKQFIESDQKTKAIIKKHFHIPSPVREDFIGEIVKEMIEDKKYSLAKIIEYLKDRKRPLLEESSGKNENLNWFFQREEMKILREDLILRLKEYAEIGINLIQYKRKILGKDTMSFGERCGTVIELILHSGDHPLIIDQPEEHLDAKFVADRVVNIIREQKINRQIIICTHNANIVVLGDSELVTVLFAGEQGTESSQGSLENLSTRKQIYNVLEGGPQAFKKREQKYGIILSPEES